MSTGSSSSSSRKKVSSKSRSFVLYSLLLTFCLAPSEDRVRKGADKLKLQMAAKQQGRLDSFFSVKAKPAEKDTDDGKGKKRKVSRRWPLLNSAKWLTDMSAAGRRSERKER